MKIDGLLVVLQACLDAGFTEIELVAKHPDSGQRIDYDIASIEYAKPVAYIHAEHKPE